MPSTVEQLSPSRAKVTVEVPFDDLRPQLDKAYKEIAQQVQIPGFRPGRVPAAIIDQRFGPGVALEQALNEALPGLYSAAVEENNLVPLTQPEIDVVRLEVNEPVEFTAEMDVRPDFELPDFSSLSVEVEPIAFDESDVDEQVEALRQRFATNIDVDREAAEGDEVTFNLKAAQDGEPVADGEAEGVTYVIGAGGMVDGLDEALTGAKAGDTKTFTSTLVGGPAEGQEADIEVSVTKVQEKELPEVDDDFAQMVSEFDTVEEMREDLRDNLQRRHRVEQANAARDAVLEELVAAVDFELPQQLLETEIEARNRQVDQELAQAGLTLKQYLEQSDEEAETEDDFRAQIAETSTSAVKAQLILDKLAEETDVQIEQEDLTQHLFARAQAAGTSPEQEMQHMLQHDHTQEWMTEIRRGKALAEVVNAASIKDTDGNVIDLKNLQSDGTYAEATQEEASDEEAQDAETETDEAQTDDAETDVVETDGAEAEQAEEKSDNDA